MTPPRTRKIMVIAGGSGGHIFPAVAFCQEFRQRHPEVEIVFATGEGKKIPELIPPEFKPVFFKTKRSVFGVFAFFSEGLRLMRRVQPEIVFGFGGYLSVPFILWAKWFGKKTVLHEQNVVLGKANWFLRAFADRVAVSFPETAARLGELGERVVVARYPLRPSLKRVERVEAARFFGFDARVLTVLVAGGSQGSRRVNEIVVDAMKVCGASRRLQVIHLAGRADREAVERAYHQMGVACKVFAFLREIHYAYSVADLVISRAGAGSIFEIAAFGLPSLLIPYPFAGRHQVENALALAKEGAALLFEEDELTPRCLSEWLDIFFEDTTRRRAMAARVSAIFSGVPYPSLTDIIDSLG